MTIKLFDLQGEKIIPTIHCYTIKDLKSIIDEYPKNYIKVYQYLFYMTCPNPDMNPFFHSNDVDKEQIILEQIKADFSVEDDSIRQALKTCHTLYETPTSRAYDGIKKALDNIARYMGNTPITDGRDGNIGQIRAVAKDFDDIRQSFKATYKDLEEEQKSRNRGGMDTAYDQP